MRPQLDDYEWTTIKPLLPNKPREFYRDDAAFGAPRNGSSIAQLRRDGAGLIMKITTIPSTPAE